MKKLIGAAAIVVAVIGSALAAQSVPYLPVPKGAAVILNTGSTNTVGYRIVIESTGRAAYVSGATRASAHVSPAVASKFFGDLKNAMPLSAMHVEACMKSASFGTMTFVWWRGQRSYDISCPGDSKTTALYDDVGAIAGALHLTGAHVIQSPPNEVYPMHTSSPGASPMSVRLIARAL